MQSDNGGGVEAADRIRVLWLIKGLGAGGAERLLVSMARTRDRVAFDYEAAYLVPWKTALVADLEDAGVPVTCLDGAREYLPAWAWRLRRRLVERPVDVVHPHSPYVAGIARLVIRTVPRRSRPRVVSTEHNSWASHARLSRFVNAVTFRADDAHVAVSDDVRASIPDRLRESVEVVTHGVELPDVDSLRGQRGAIRGELGVAPEQILIGTVANFRAQKRHGEILAIARTLVDKGLPVKFAFLGQGPLEDDIRRQVRAMDLDEQVMVVGYQRDVWPYLASFDLFLLASEYEGLPVAVMEAMAMGVPIVATAAGGLRTAVRDGIDGRLVPVDEPQRLVDAIIPLVEDRTLLAAYSQAALERGSTFDVSHATRHFERLYREAAARAHGRAPDAARSIS